MFLLHVEDRGERWLSAIRVALIQPHNVIMKKCFSLFLSLFHTPCSSLCHFVILSFTKWEASHRPPSQPQRSKHNPQSPRSPPSSPHPLFHHFSKLMLPVSIHLCVSLTLQVLRRCPPREIWAQRVHLDPLLAIPNLYQLRQLTRCAFGICCVAKYVVARHQRFDR